MRATGCAAWCATAATGCCGCPWPAAWSRSMPRWPAPSRSMPPGRRAAAPTRSRLRQVSRALPTAYSGTICTIPWPVYNAASMNENPGPNTQPGAGNIQPDTPLHAIQALVAAIEQRARRYLQLRTDNEEQTDHLRHVASRTRWLYDSELRRADPGAGVGITEHDDALIQACVFSHDIGKWIPRDDLRALVPADPETLRPYLAELTFSSHQSGLFLLALRRRFDLPQDGYTPEYDSAHHLVSAFLLARDETLGLQHLDPADQARLIKMIIGHQFGSYFKESLLHVTSASEVTTGMLRDVSRPDRLTDDMLACAFHDADISDLLFIGSL